MKAVRVEGFGSVERLALVDVEVPVPREDEVLVRVSACALNFSDVLKREGEYLGGPLPPFISGSEAAGTLEASGQRVSVLVESGAHAQWVVARRDACFEIPAAMSFHEAAAFPVSYLTAYHALVTCARAQAGESAMILAAAGGLGSAALQIARCLGLRVIAVASTDEKRERALDLGADRAIDYHDIRHHRADLVIDPVGGAAHRAALLRLRAFGRMVVVGCASREPRPIDSHALIFRSQTVSGIHLDAISKEPELVRAALTRLFEWIEKGEIRIQVGSVLPLEQIGDAHESLEGRESLFKTVLVP